MFIVKRKTDLLRFGLFLLLAGLMAYYVAGRFSDFQSAGRESPEPAAAGPILTGPQSADLIQRAAEASDGSDFFAETRMDRERNRGALKAAIKQVMEDQSADADVRKQATEQYLAVSNTASLEEKAETLVKAKGFADALVSLQGASAQVVVKGKSFSEPQLLQVVDMVSKITGIKAAGIVVIPRDR